MDEVSRTIRQEISAFLEEGEATIRDISKSVGISEKDIYGHLNSIEKSLKNRGKRLCLHPYQCLDCGFSFDDRKRYSRPGKCPKCKGERMDPALFWIEIE